MAKKTRGSSKQGVTSDIVFGYDYKVGNASIGPGGVLMTPPVLSWGGTTTVYQGQAIGVLLVANPLQVGQSGRYVVHSIEGMIELYPLATLGTIAEAVNVICSAYVSRFDTQTGRFVAHTAFDLNTIQDGPFLFVEVKTGDCKPFGTTVNPSFPLKIVFFPRLSSPVTLGADEALVVQVENAAIQVSSLPGGGSGGITPCSCSPPVSTTFFLRAACHLDN